MRIWRYRNDALPSPRVAVAVPGGGPLDLVVAWSLATGEDEVPPYLWSVATLIEAGPEAWEAVRSLIAASPEEPTVWQGAPGFRWVCPLDRLASLRDFLAFESHVRQGAERRGSEVPAYWYEAPVYYKGNHRRMIGPEETCPWPSYTTHLDFELEMAMIVGRPGTDIAVPDAPGHIFGFSVLNDFSARDMQAKEATTWLGPAKAKDFCTGLGPCIVTADELGAQPDLAMACRVNGEEWGRGRSSEARWSWAEMIAHVSAGEGVEAGDVYGSGTPGGCCGLDLGRRLAPGDVVELEIEGIGVLRNPVGAPMGATGG
ncbi:MAG TPA: fumarylacetoacetate hydrolase family protein [Actinomycetota bacterium]|nr:fumarylacetoacetate hydrolase family protein [Actinomycetota bacterium]